MKIKKISILLFCVFGAISINAQWTRTNISTVVNANIEDMCEHNDELYASMGGLMKLNETSQQWNKVENNLPPNSNSAHIIRLASSGNNLYAFVQNQSPPSTTIYKSKDGGITFETDTVGIPRHPKNFFMALYRDQLYSVGSTWVLSDKLIVEYSGGFYSKYPEDAVWVRETDPDVKFSELFGEYNGTWYAWANYKFRTSRDKGQTWTGLTGNGLPDKFEAKILNVNLSSGRVYIAGTSHITGEYKLLYSDDEGNSWKVLPFNQFLGTNWMGQTQTIHGMISHGNNITAMLVNDANNSHPDVIRSTDGGQTFSVDTVGLQPNAFGTVLVSRMLYFRGKLYLAPNYHDIYTQNAGALSVNKVSTINIQAYPNPCTNQLNLQSSENIIKLEVLNTNGQIISSINSDINKLMLENYPQGVYFIKVYTSSGTETIKIMKK